MKNYYILMLCLSIAHILSAQNPNPSSEIDALFTTEMQNHNIPGLATLAIKNGEIVWMESYGLANTSLQKPFTDTTSLQLASVSKLFTATAIMQLVENGTLDLDAPINNYLPFTIKNPRFPDTHITTRMLLTHTSSIRDDLGLVSVFYNWEGGDPKNTLAETMKNYLSEDGEHYRASNFLRREPGRAHHYTNIGNALEGYLVEVISGMPFYEYCNQNIFQPLCMTNTHWLEREYEDTSQIAHAHVDMVPVPHYSYNDYPSGLLKSNIRDLSHFMFAILQQGNFHDFQLLQGATIDSMTSVQFEVEPLAQGLQFFAFPVEINDVEKALWGHTGGEKGVSTVMLFDFESQLATAVLINTEASVGPIFEILYELALEVETTGVGNPPCDRQSTSSNDETTAAITIFPNPASDVIYIADDHLSWDQMEIRDLLGRSVLQLPNTGDKSVDVSQLTSGEYIGRITAKQGIKTFKIIIN